MDLWGGKIDWIKNTSKRATPSVLNSECFRLIVWLTTLVTKPRPQQGGVYNSLNHSQIFKVTDFSLGNNGKTQQEVMSARSYETFVMLKTWTKFIREELAVLSPTSRLPFLLVMPENPKKWRRKLTYKWISVSNCFSPFGRIFQMAKISSPLGSSEKKNFWFGEKQLTRTRGR